MPGSDVIAPGATAPMMSWGLGSSASTATAASATARRACARRSGAKAYG